MNALDLLRESHRRLDESLRRRSPGEALQRELALHAEMEEKVFHAALREAFGDEAWSAVRAAEDELQEARRVLDILLTLPPADARARDLLEDVRRGLERHALQEERGVFRAAKNLGKERLERVGGQLTLLKDPVDSPV